MSPDKNTILQFTKYLKDICPNPKCLLTFNKDYEFLIKVMLSAQSKDTEVNKYADILFEKFPSLEKINEAPIKEIEQIIKPLGFSKNKSANIKDITKQLLNNFDGKVPSTKEELMSMKGVGNKTANCILNEIFHQNFIAVDTHVQRVCKRLGLVKENFDAKQIEEYLNKVLPDSEKLFFSNRTIWFGRNICTAKKPNCSICKMNSFCNRK